MCERTSARAQSSSSCFSFSSKSKLLYLLPSQLSTITSVHPNVVSEAQLANMLLTSGEKKVTHTEGMLRLYFFFSTCTLKEVFVFLWVRASQTYIVFVSLSLSSKPFRGGLKQCGGKKRPMRGQHSGWDQCQAAGNREHSCRLGILSFPKILVLTSIGF